MTIAAYRDHPLRSQIEQIGVLLTNESFSDQTVLENESYLFARNKVIAIVQLLKLLLEQTPAELASVQALGVMHANLQSPFAELNAFISNKNSAHIVNAASQLESNVQPYFWGLPVKSENEAIKAFPALLKKQAETADLVIRHLQAEKDKLETELEAATTMAEALQSRLETMQESAAKERAEASAAVANLQKDFAENETERATKFEQVQKEFKDTFKQDHDVNIQSANQTILELNTLRDQAAQIVQIVGNIGVTGNYQRIAESEGKQANMWRWITIGIFALGISAAIATFIKFWGQPLSPDTLWSVAIRLLYAIAITAPAWYTARESARHRTNADRARQTELELASIGPFIELMPEEKKIEIKEALTKSYFGRSIPDHQVQSPVDAIPFKEVVELVKAAVAK